MSDHVKTCENMCRHVNPCENVCTLDSNRKVVYKVDESLRATKMTDINEGEAIKAHKEAFLDAVCLNDLPKFEVYGLENGISVVKHDRRYANFFK